MRHFAAALITMAVWSLLSTESLSQETSPTDFPSEDVVLTDEARAINRAALLVDGHNDLPWAVRDLGSSFNKVDIRQPQPKLHTDIPRIREGGLKAQFWSVYVPASTDRTGNALLQTLEQIDLVHEMVAHYPDVFEMVHTAGDIERIVADGKVASMIGVEGGHSIQNRLSVLQKLYERGARYMTLTHSKTLDWADSATDEPRSGGLSPFGEDVVREMNRLGMLVDLSHVSPETMVDALRITKAPVIFSHSSARSICDHPRNVPDEVLKKLPGNGGVVMINFFSGFIVPTDQLKEDKNRLGSVKTVVDHIEHVAKVAGIDHVGLGSDFDGIPRVPHQLSDVAHYPYVTQELLNRGYSRGDIEKILGQNLLRALKQAEEVSQQIRAESKPTQ
jgi:membrane dipeptidase